MAAVSIRPAMVVSIAAGYTTPMTSTHSDVYLVKTDAFGDTVWTRTFGGNLSDKGYDVKQTSDGEFIAVGTIIPSGESSTDVYLIKTDGMVMKFGLATMERIITKLAIVLFKPWMEDMW